jgi:hypothetical protein
MVREWIIFALCLGLGGHIALGIILHAPEVWPWQDAGMRGLLIGLSCYVAVQVMRSLWWLIRGRARSNRESPGNSAL